MIKKQRKLTKEVKMMKKKKIKNKGKGEINERSQRRTQKEIKFRIEENSKDNI